METLESIVMSFVNNIISATDWKQEKVWYKYTTW